VPFRAPSLSSQIQFRGHAHRALPTDDKLCRVCPTSSPTSRAMQQAVPVLSSFGRDDRRGQRRSQSASRAEVPIVERRCDFLMQANPVPATCAIGSDKLAKRQRRLHRCKALLGFAHHSCPPAERGCFADDRRLRVDRRELVILLLADSVAFQLEQGEGSPAGICTDLVLTCDAPGPRSYVRATGARIVDDPQLEGVCTRRSR
jgi:hypothetical protein